jgi:hypothetical protein
MADDFRVVFDGDDAPLNRVFARVEARGGKFSTGMRGAMAGASAAWAAAAVGVGVLAVGLDRAFEAADALDASNRKLGATAKITGQNLGFLKKVAADANAEFKLGARVSNDFSIEISKLTSKAGAVEKTGDAIRAALDLGAARGLSAAETLQSVQQAILGIDEGTDRLFGKNPSVIYAEFAKKVGVSTSALTDNGKAMAILSALMEDGGKVAGEYAEYLKSPAGQQEQLRTRVEQTTAAIGRSMQAIRLQVYPVLAKFATLIAEAVGGLRILAAQFPVLSAQAGLWAAQMNDAFGGALEGIARKLTSFGEWLRTLPLWVRVIFPIANAAQPVGSWLSDAIEGGVDAARARLDAAISKAARDVARIRAEVRGMMADFGDTDPVSSVVSLFDTKGGRGRRARPDRETADEREARERRELILSGKAHVGNVIDPGMPRGINTRNPRYAGPVFSGPLSHPDEGPARGSSVTGLGGPMFDVAARVATSLGEAGGMLKGFGGELLAVLGPVGVVAAVLEGAFEGLRPVLDALKEPLRVVGEILGRALAPILKALFPVFKLVAIAATYIGEIFFKVSGGIAKAVGALVYGLGVLIKLIPGDNGLGEKIKSAGKGIQAVGAGFLEGAGELAKGREQLKNLQWNDALDPLKEGARAAASEVQNMAHGWKVELRRFQATNVSTSPVSPGVPVGSSSAGGGSTVRFEGDIVIQTTGDGRDVYERFRAELGRRARASGAEAQMIFRALPA